MKVLVDTSVWIDHLRRPSNELRELLNVDLVLTHPAVLGELACGNLRNRSEFLRDLRLLPCAVEARFDEVLALIEVRKLYGKGLGWVDMQLLTSAALSEARLWTRDTRLSTAAQIRSRA